jgi:hypothetical protein
LYKCPPTNSKKIENTSRTNHHYNTTTTMIKEISPVI